MRNITLVISMMIITFSLFFIGSETVNASDWKTTNKKYGYDQPLKNLTGCTFKGDVTDEALEIRGIAKKKNGRTINKKLFKDSCFLVYGSPSDVKDNKTKDSYGNQKYLGYDQFGKKAVNPKYNTHGDVFQGNLVLRNTFFKIGSGKSQVNKNFIAERRLYKGIPVPTTNKQGSAMKKAGKSVEDVLDTAYDTTRIIYRWQNTSKMPSRNQLRGNFTKERNSTDPFGNKSSPGGVLTGKRLTSYANITQVPSDYSPGTFQMYHKCAPNNKTFRLCYSGYTIPPIKEFGKEKESVVLNKFSVSPKELWEKEKITTNFTIKNDGEIGVKDPNMKVTLSCDGFTSKTKHKKFKGIFKPGKTKKGELTFNAPQLTGNTKSDDVECKVSIDRGNDIKKSSYSVKSGVSTSHKLKVKRVKRDLYVKDLEVLGDDYFEKDNGGLYDNKERIFEGDVVHFRYKLGYRSNKKNESVTNPVVDLGNEGLDGIEGKHKPKITLKAGTKKTDKENGMDYYNESDWIYPDFKDNNYDGSYEEDTKEKFGNKTSSADGVLDKIKGLLKTEVVYANSKAKFEVEKNTLIKYNGTEKNVVIPPTINNIVIHYIGPEAFKGKEIESVTIPSSVHYIGEEAFANNKLTEIVLPSSVNVIQYRAFADNQLNKIDIKNSGTNLVSNAFHGQVVKGKVYNKPSEVDFDSLVDYRIEGKRVELRFLTYNDPEIKNVEEFFEQGDIYSIETSLENGLYFESDDHNLVFVGMFDKIGVKKDACFETENVSGGVSITKYNPDSCDMGTDVEIPSEIDGKKVVEISESSFKNKGITSVNIPDTVKKIGQSAFYENKIEKLDIGDGVENIDNNAFAINLLKELNLGSNLKKIGPGAFHNGLAIDTDGLVELTIPSSVKEIGDFAFYSHMLERLHLSSGISSIGDRAFYGNELSQIEFPKTLNSVGPNAFFRSGFVETPLLVEIENVKTTFENSPFGETAPGRVFVYGNNTNLKNDATKNDYYYNSYMADVEDKNLNSCLYNGLQKDNGKVRSYEFLMNNVTELDCGSKNIKSVNGIFKEVSSNGSNPFSGSVRKIKLNDNSITDIKELLVFDSGVEFEVTNQRNESNDDSFNISHYNRENLVIGTPVEFSSDEGLDLSNSSFGTIENGKVMWDPSFELYTPVIKHSFSSDGINFSGEVFYDTAENDPDMPEIGEDNTDFEDDFEEDVCDSEENSDDDACATVDGDDFDEGESIDTDDSIESLDNIPTAGMIKDNLNASGIVTEREYFKEYEEKVFTEVNRNAKKPKYEEDRKEDNKAKLNWYNNKKELPYNTVHRVYDLGIKIKDIRPTYPKSNETIEVDIQVCNHGNMDVGKYSYELKLGDPNRQSDTDVVFKKERSGIERGAYNNIDVVDNCKLFTEEIKVMDVEKMTEDMKLIGEIEIDNIPNGYKDVDPSNNKDDKDVTVRNPNASISLKNETGESGVISETGGVSLVVRNNMFKDISDSCQGDECKLNTENRNTYATVTNLETNKSENVVIDYNNLGHGKAKSYDLSNVVERLIGDGGPDNYRAIEFEIKAGIPHYKNEVDYSGDAKYGDNDLVEKVKYYPERLMLQACNEIDSNGYFKFIGGNGTESSDGDLIKSCAGHYPNFPSTSIEKGMESYHYFMYRFLPAPLPKYIIENSGVDDKTNPEYFNQTFKVESDINEEPGEDYIITKREGDRAMERARYIPTGAVFNYKITEKKEDGGKLIATGKVNYNLDNQECNMRDNLDVKHQYGCDEVMLFLPNVDGNKFKKPAPSDGNFNYPVENTRVPYLNPGLYEFSVDVDERYELVKQYNKGEREEYYWKNTND